MGRKMLAWLRAKRLEVMRLEDRTLPASGLTATLTQGLLSIVGTDGPDVIRVHQRNGTVTVDGVSGSFAAGQIRAVDIRALGGNDLVDLRGSGNDPVTITGVRVDGGAGNDTLVGGPGGDV